MAWGSSCESPLVPCASVGLSRLFSLSACRILLAVWLPCSVVCPGFRPALLAVSEFTQDTNPAHAYALRCLSLLAVLRAFPVRSACCIHSCMDPKTLHGLPFSLHCIPGFAFITHPCSTNGAHAVMVCVVMIQAHLHSLSLSRPSRLFVEPLFSLPVTFHFSPCPTWCMRRSLRPDR